MMGRRKSAELVAGFLGLSCDELEATMVEAAEVLVVGWWCFPAKVGAEIGGGV